MVVLDLALGLNGLTVVASQEVWALSENWKYFRLLLNAKRPLVYVLVGSEGTGHEISRLFLKVHSFLLHEPHILL